MHDTPYLHLVGEQRQMKGKGAPTATVFGVLGHTKESGLTKSLGGLVKDSASGKIKPGTIMKHAVPSDHHLMGSHAPKTHISGYHYGQVPYAGKFMGDVGNRLS